MREQTYGVGKEEAANTLILFCVTQGLTMSPWLFWNSYADQADLEPTENLLPAAQALGLKVCTTMAVDSQHFNALRSPMWLESTLSRQHRVNACDLPTSDDEQQMWFISARQRLHRKKGYFMGRACH